MRIAEDERTYVAAEAEALSVTLDEASRGRYRAVADAAAAGEVPDELVDELGALVALTLETGRARAVHGAPGVRALASVWKRTPQGERTARELDDLNEALSVLRGLPVGRVRVAMSAPGAVALSISAGQYEARLEVDRTGVRLKSIDVGGGSGAGAGE